MWTPVFVANMMASVLFLYFLSLEGTWPGWSHLWEPALIGALYLAGQSFILVAVNVGDVSVAAPVASLKVLVVALLLTVLAGSTPAPAIWVAACLATTGVFLINFFVPTHGRANVMMTALLAFLAACTFALFDVCVQMFSPKWGTGALAPISYGFVALFSLILIPWIDRPGPLFREMRWKSLLIGCGLVAIQASFLVYSVSTFGNAASINVVYSLRGLWGVVFAWTLASYFGGNELKTPTRTMLIRLAGASLLVTAVIVTILSQGTE